MEVSGTKSSYQTHEKSDRDQQVETSWTGLSQFLLAALQNLPLLHILLMVSEKAVINSYLSFMFKM